MTSSAREVPGEHEPVRRAGPADPARPDRRAGPGRLAGHRDRHPRRLLIRGLAAALLCLGVLAVIPGQPAAPALVAALITWFVVTGRSDLAPPRHR